jgi:DhnA family fructose-bisphosphate aldolase class Ia
MHTGKELRLRRIIDANGTSVMFAFSHGTSAPTVLPGLERPAEMVAAAAQGGATCVFAGTGLANALAPAVAEHPGLGIVAKVTATESRSTRRSRPRVSSTRCGRASTGSSRCSRSRLKTRLR